MTNPVKEKSTSQPQYFFICGSDDYLVDREGRKLYTHHSAGLSDDFSCEIIDANAQNVANVESIIKQFIDSAQMPSLFAEKKVIWLRGINFLADSPTARAESSKSLVQTLIEVLAKLDYSTVSIIITASPVDKRTRLFKALKNTPSFQLLEDTTNPHSLSQLISHECQTHNIKISQDAIDLLLLKTNNNSRLLLHEVQKLITFVANDSQPIDTKLINEMVAQFGESDFFEFSDAFFSLDLNWTLDALTRHFFTQKESRPLIASLQNRLHLLIQLRVLLDSSSIEPNSYGLNKNTLQSLASEYNLPFADPSTKSSFNIFSQNPWYLAKLTSVAKKIPLKKLIDFQLALIHTFEQILKFPQEQEAIMRQLVMQCLVG